MDSTGIFKDFRFYKDCQLCGYLEMKNTYDFYKHFYDNLI